MIEYLFWHTELLFVTMLAQHNQLPLEQSVAIVLGFTSLPLHRLRGITLSFLVILDCKIHNLFELNPVLGGVRDIPSDLISHEQTELIKTESAVLNLERLIRFFPDYLKVKSMQRSGTEAIRTQILLSKPKREITNITNSQNTKENIWSTE